MIGEMEIGIDLHIMPSLRIDNISTSAHHAHRYQLGFFELS